MPYFKEIKANIREYFNNGEIEIQGQIPEFLKNIPYEKWISPLFACLLEEAYVDKAAHLLGFAINKINLENPEKAKIIIRRFIWQMNEESGNIAWGIPQAFAQALVHSAELADYYYKILISYIRSQEGDGNYCDYAPLRFHCLQAVETLISAYPKYIAYALPPLKDALNDTDKKCQKEAIKIYEKFKKSIQNEQA